MSAKKIIAGMVMDENTTITFVEICEQYEIPEELLVELLDYGVLKSNAKNIRCSTFDYQSLTRIQSAIRLKHDLGINTPGIALALDLLDKVEKLEEELGVLQRHIDNP